MTSEMRVLSDVEVDAVAGGPTGIEEGCLIVVAGGLVLGAIAVGGVIGYGLAKGVEAARGDEEPNTSLEEVINDMNQDPPQDPPGGGDDE